MPSLTLVAAIDDRFGLSRGTLIPWDCGEDRRHFRDTTSVPDSILLMGRGTYLSMLAAGVSWGPRRPIVLSSAPLNDVAYFASLDEALAPLADDAKVFVVGGERLYAEALRHTDADRLCLTLVDGDYGCTTFFPRISPSAFLEGRRTHLSPKATVVEYLRVRYDRPPAVVPERPTHGEVAYLCLVQEALRAPLTANRTGIPTRALFGRSLRFDLSRHAFPLLTTRRLNFEAIAEELQWFLRGVPDATRLRTRIWAGNTTRAALDAAGLLQNPVGDAGPIYPFQWRHSGAPYPGASGADEAKGVDQIAALVAGLKRDPDSRRHLVCAWNPSDLPRMCLPPCHFAFQVVVKNSRASLVVYQRSADLGLGVPFNIASYALLLRLLCAECALKPGEVVLHFGDVHVYANHEGALDTQLRREVLRPPVLHLVGDRPAAGWVDGFDRKKSVALDSYDSHPALHLPMAV